MTKTKNSPLSALASLATDRPRHGVRTDCVSVEPRAGRVVVTAGSESVAASVDLVAHGQRGGSPVHVEAHSFGAAVDDGGGETVEVINGVAVVDGRALSGEDGVGVGRELVPGVRLGSARVKVSELLKLIRAASKSLGPKALLTVDARPGQGAVIVAGGGKKDEIRFTGACRAVPADGVPAGT